MEEALATAERRPRQAGNSSAAVDTGLEMIGELLDCGDVGRANWWMDRIGAGLGRDADARQSMELSALRIRLAELSEREAAGGGPGSLFDLKHAFAVARREARERALRFSQNGFE